MNLIEKIEKNAVLIIIIFMASVIIIATMASILIEEKQTAIRVNMNLIEEVDTILTQEVVGQSNTSDINFPLIIGTATLKNANVTFGSSSTRYHGTGRYVLDINFQGYRPKKNDEIRLSILVTNKNGDTLGNFAKDLIWR
ncbi:MAG: hypothetical protein SCH70_11680 [Candidatus Methanoperedens sp.]|nr:hypothetical protein [Candidatus Methanoperedens sp.]